MTEEELKKEMEIELVEVFDDGLITSGKSHYLDIWYEFQLKFKEKVYDFAAYPFGENYLPEEIRKVIDEYAEANEIDDMIDGYVTADEIVFGLIEEKYEEDDFENIASEQYILERGILCGTKDDKEEIEAAQKLFDEFDYELPAVLYCDKEIEAICGYLVQIDYTNNRVSHSALVTKALLEAVERNIEKADYISISDLEYYNAWLDVIREFE